MTADSMVTKGTFADFKIIKTRKLAQLIIEIPIEAADAALAALGGLPQSDRERWVAVARLENELPNDLHPLNTFARKHRHAFFSLPATQQAAILSKDANFQNWVNGGFTGETDCASEIRKRCGVESRADILPGTDAEMRWKELLREYEGFR